MMGKPLVNREKWTRNDFRLLVVLLLTVIYPIIASSFFTLFVFVIMPAHSLVQGPHIYWLTAALLWILLCAVILPCFRDKEASGQSVGMDFQESPTYPTKPHAVQPFVKVEEGLEKQRLSLLTNKSKGSSVSIDKGLCEEKADKESLEKSKENLKRSNASLSEKDKITQSGEFLNECIDSLGSDKLQEEEAECQVHAEQEDRVKDEMESVRNDAVKKENDNSSSSSSSDDESHPGTRNAKQDSSDSDEEVLERKEAKPLELESGKIQEIAIPEEEEETADLEAEGVVTRRKALPTIDTSRASDYYECSMPTPKSAGNGRPESNMVFLFVNPDIAATEEDIIVNHQGDVQEQQSKE